MAKLYPSDLVQELSAHWKAPWEVHLDPTRAEPAYVRMELTPNHIREAVEVVYYASLKTDEGEMLKPSIVLAPDAAALEMLDRGDWIDGVRLTRPVDFDLSHATKLARVASGGGRFLVVSFSGERLVVVGLATPPAQVFLSADYYPRIQVFGPADLVFFRGSTPLFRYRHGERELFNHDFFVSSWREARSHLACQVTPDFAAEETRQDTLVSSISQILDLIVRSRHGGLLAVLGPDEEEPPFNPDFRTDGPNYGRVAHAALERLIEWEETGMSAEQGFADSSEEADEERDALEAHRRMEVAAATVAGMASVDGAVLLTAALKVVGFGCKLPRPLGDLPPVVEAWRTGAEHQPYPLQQRGTRHAAAAAFVEAHKGRFAFTVSADGPISCFWKRAANEPVYYWPAYIGSLRAIF